MRILSRYISREVVVPFTIGLLVFTFILIVPYVIQVAEQLIAKGVPWPTVVRIMVTLLPQALGLTIPMALLIGLLVAFGRLSGDREFVAMQACGVSLLQLLRPVAVLAIAGWAATSWVLIWAVPSANQSYREITYDIIVSRAEGEVRPRVFFEDFPNLVLYVNEIPPDGSGWRDVFLADTRDPAAPVIFVAERGRVVIDRARRTVDMVLEHGARHTAKPNVPADYEVLRFDRLVLSVDPENVFPRTGPAKGEREMTIPELRALASEMASHGESPHSPLMEIHKKFSIPIACLVFGVIGLGLGVTNRRDGKLASFVLGIGVIFTYYVVMWTGQSMAKGRLIAPWLALWLPNIVLGLAGAVLFAWRSRAVDQPVRVSLPSWPWRRRAAAAPAVATPGTRPETGRRVGMTFRIPQFDFPGPTLLDRYVAASYARHFLLSSFGMAGLFYISTFVDLSDKLFKGTATMGMVLTYFGYATPQYVYYIIPLAVLLATLITIGILTKNSELIVMRACGISLYRVAVPMLGCAVLAGSVLFGLEETILGSANRNAEALRHVIRGGDPQMFDVLNRKWVTGRDGQIYHYVFFDPRTRELNGLSVYEFSRTGTLERRTYAAKASFAALIDGGGGQAQWAAAGGWVREFTGGEHSRFQPFAARTLALERPDYFITEQPDADRMSYTQLRTYVDRLAASGFDIVPQQVELQRKLSFPFVTLIMTLIAVPFAVTTGQRGALYGVGVGIALALVYWITISVFAAVGKGGLIQPWLAAWAPNLLFGAGAAYGLLTVRT